MGKVIWLPKRHARASAGSDGYKSGRNSWRGTPDARSTASTRKGGTSFHWQTACADTPTILPNAAGPPAALIARPRASRVSLMADRSSIALPGSQATLHCARKASLYDAVMTFEKRLIAARERRGWNQPELASKFGITKQAVREWEIGKSKPAFERLPKLAQVLEVPIRWLLAGSGPPPQLDALEALIDGLSAEQRASLIGMIETFLPPEPAQRKAHQ